MASQSYVYGSGVTNIQGVNSFELGNTYTQYDIVFFSGYTDTPTEYTANQLGSSTGHYYYTGSSAITATTANSPDVSSSDWTQKLFLKPSYGASVSYDNVTFDISYGDGYYSKTSKSENSLKTQFDMPFAKLTDKESRALIHLFEDSFNKNEKNTGAYSGIFYTPFPPYDQEHEFYIENFDRTYENPDVNFVSTKLYREDQSKIDWQQYFIPFHQTRGFYQEGETYSLHDIVYLSGAANRILSGWYYYTGLNESVSNIGNSPSGNNSLWTNDTFYFELNKGINITESPRYIKFELQNDYFIRTKDGINKSLLNFKFVLQGRTDKEAKAIIHFMEHKQGQQQFRFTPPAPYNKDNLVFMCPNWKHTLNYKDNNDIELNFMQFPINLLNTDISWSTLITIDPYFKGPNQI